MLRDEGVGAYEWTGGTDGADWRAIDRELRRLAKAQAALDVEIARWLREAERARIWRKLGFASALEYLEAVFGYAPRTALERLRVATALGELRQIEASLAAGDVSYSAARELTRIATPKTEQAWLRAAAGCNLRQIEQLVAGKQRGALPTDAADPELVTQRVTFELPPRVVALLRQTRAALDEEHGEHLDDVQFIETLCRSALEPACTAPARPAHQVAITVCPTCKQAEQLGAGRGAPLAPNELSLATCDAHLIDLDGNSTRVTSTIPPATRRKVWLRDQGRCRVPGCRAARNLDIHHILHREDGGTHDPANLVVLCSGHHTAHHDGKLRITGRAPDHLTFDRIEPNRFALASLHADAKSALVRLGYKPAQARAALDHVRAHVGATSLESLLRAALQQLAGNLKS